VIVGHAIRAFVLKETVMRHVTYIVAIGTIAAAVAGCADPYAPRSGYSQGYNSGYSQSYNYPSGYSYPATSSYPSGSGYYPTRYGYGSNGDYNRNYGGTRSSPQVTFTFP
jgi:hypothetical protein